MVFPCERRSSICWIRAVPSAYGGEVSRKHMWWELSNKWISLFFIFISHYCNKKFLFETFIYLLIILILSERMGTMEHHLYLTRVLHTKIGVKFRGNNRKLITCQFDNASWTSWRDPTSSQVWSGPIPLSPRARTAEVRFPSKKCFKWRAILVSWQLSIVFKDTQLLAPSSDRLMEVTTGSILVLATFGHQELMRDVGTLSPLAGSMFSTQSSPPFSNIVRGIFASVQPE